MSSVRRRSLWGAQSGQAMVEYVGLTTIIPLGLLVGAVSLPWGATLFRALQAYVDLYFYALNVGLG